VDFLSKKFLQVNNGTKDTHGKMVANMNGNVYRKRAAVKLVFTTVYSSSAAPSFAVRQNLLAALLMRKRRENQFYSLYSSTSAPNFACGKLV